MLQYSTSSTSRCSVNIQTIKIMVFEVITLSNDNCTLSNDNCWQFPIHCSFQTTSIYFMTKLAQYKRITYLTLATSQNNYHKDQSKLPQMRQMRLILTIRPSSNPTFLLDNYWNDCMATGAEIIVPLSKMDKKVTVPKIIHILPIINWLPER